jgi:hypothetical protein
MSHTARIMPIRLGAAAALVVDQGSNPFEMACACEVFGARRRSEIGFELDELTVVAPTRTTMMRDGLFRLSARIGHFGISPAVRCRTAIAAG